MAFSFKNFNKKSMINDLVKNATILTAVHILTKTRAKANLFDEDSLYHILFILLGFVFYHVVMVNIIPRQ
jgi:hypothetical protein